MAVGTYCAETSRHFYWIGAVLSCALSIGVFLKLFFFVRNRITDRHYRALTGFMGEPLLDLEQDDDYSMVPFVLEVKNLMFTVKEFVYSKCTRKEKHLANNISLSIASGTLTAIMVLFAVTSLWSLI